MPPSALPVFEGTLDDAADMLCSRMRRGRGSVVAGLNAAVFNELCVSDELAASIRKVTMLLPDGMSVVWAWRALGRPISERIATPDLVDRLLEDTQGARVYLIGGTESVNLAASAALTARGVNVVGRSHGYWPSGGVADVIECAVAASADLILLALPSPTKEILALELSAVLPACCVIGVGGYFDILSGTIRRAPGWIGKLGFEWLFRLVQEPQRLARRYLVGNLRFVVNVVRTRGTGRVAPRMSSK